MSPPSKGTCSSRTPRRAPGNAGASSRMERFSSKAMAANSWATSGTRSCSLEAARRGRAGYVGRADLEAHAAGRREQGEGKGEADRTVLLDQAGGRIGEPLHHLERVHRDLVE